MPIGWSMAGWTSAALRTRNFRNPIGTARIHDISNGRASVIPGILCDDHAVVRRGIPRHVDRSTGHSGYRRSGKLRRTARILREGACDVLLLDLNMPGRSGLEVLASLRETDSEIKVLVVSMYPEDQYAVRCLRAGAQGYASKASDPVALIEAVRTIMQGRKYLTPEVAQMLAESVSRRAPEYLIQLVRNVSYKLCSRLPRAGDCLKSQRS